MQKNVIHRNNEKQLFILFVSHTWPPFVDAENRNQGRNKQYWNIVKFNNALVHVIYNKRAFTFIDDVV